MVNRIPNPTQSTTAVSHVATKPHPGTEHQHAIEPELAHANIPRMARLTPRTLLLRRLLWNGALVALGLVAFLAQRDLAKWDSLIEHGVTVRATIYDTVETDSGREVSFRFETDSGPAYGRKHVSRGERHMFGL
jgi:hypothetical protein